MLDFTEQMDVIPMPKDIDPDMTARKDASILSCLESTQELWIYGKTALDVLCLE